MTIRIALTGTGYISRIHAAAAQKLPEVALAAVVNHRSESRDAFAVQYGILRQYDTVEQLLEDGDVDALIISTPNYLHAPQTISALQYRVHVMVEKPMAMNTEEARRMQDVANASGTLLMVAHCWRFDKEVQWLRGLIAAQRLGTIVRSKGYGVHVNWGPGGWFTQQKYAGGGALADMGIHAIDTARYLLGDPQPRSVYARIGTYYNEIDDSFDVDDTGVILIEWEGGTTSYIESGWWQPHAAGAEAATELYGTSGFGQIYPTYARFPRERGTKDDFRVLDPGFQFPREPHCLPDMYEAQLAYFVRCILNGKSPTPGAAEGIVNMALVDAAYESARTGEVVTL